MADRNRNMKMYKSMRKARDSRPMHNLVWWSRCMRYHRIYCFFWWNYSSFWLKIKKKKYCYGDRSRCCRKINFMNSLRSVTTVFTQAASAACVTVDVRRLTALSLTSALKLSGWWGSLHDLHVTLGCGDANSFSQTLANGKKKRTKESLKHMVWPQTDAAVWLWWFIHTGQQWACFPDKTSLADFTSGLSSAAKLIHTFLTWSTVSFAACSSLCLISGQTVSESHHM